MLTNLRGIALKNIVITNVIKIGDDVIVSFNDKSEMVMNASEIKTAQIEVDEHKLKYDLIMRMREERDGKVFLVNDNSNISVEI